MSKNKQHTGVFNLEDVTNKIELKPLEDKQKEDIAPTIIAPKILVDATGIKTTNNTIPIDRALLIVKEQMRLSGIRKATIREYVYTFNSLVDHMNFT